MQICENVWEEFIYIISHDIRAEFRALRELPVWIREDIAEAGYVLDADLSENIDCLSSRADRIDRMMEGLLKYTRVGTNESSGQSHLKAALSNALDLVPNPNGFRITSTLPDRAVGIAEQDLVTLFEELIKNAIQHHDKPIGNIAINASLSGGSVYLDIIDDGPGIPPEKVDMALQVLTSLSPAKKTHCSGMGLPICQKIASRYAGSLSLQPAQEPPGLHVRLELLELRSKAPPVKSNTS
ncbi:MAG: HAMP domain-containing sensor histidine kinase [Pseudomonadota bacterium]